MTMVVSHSKKPFNLQLQILVVCLDEDKSSIMQDINEFFKTWQPLVGGL